MSASLVGSEMCIRDRPSALLRGQRANRPPGWGPFARFIKEGPSALSRACLLYTSDAADDM
eukprot:9192086-Alexandrium_andersonii.AAC.1